MTNTTPTTTAQATVLTGIRQCLAQGEYAASIPAEQDIAWLLDYIDALTEQVRVLRPVVEWYADAGNWDDDARADLGYNARRALAALEGSGESE